MEGGRGVRVCVLVESRPGGGKGGGKKGCEGGRKGGGGWEGTEAYALYISRMQRQVGGWEGGGREVGREVGREGGRTLISGHHLANSRIQFPTVDLGTMTT